MAIGDAAVAAGMALVNGATTPAKDLDREDNLTRDYIAGERTARLAALAGKVDKPADGAAMARMEPGSGHSIGFYTTGDSTLYFRPIPTTAVYDRRVAMFSEIPTVPGPPDLSSRVAKSGDSMSGDLSVPQLFARDAFAANSGYVIAYLNSDNRLARGASSERYKKYLREVDPDELGDIWPAFHRFQMRSQDGSPSDNTWRYGYIAERLAEHEDQERFVVYADIDGEVLPDSIDFIGLLMAQVAQLHQRDQEHDAVIGDLLARIEALEARQ